MGPGAHSGLKDPFEGVEAHNTLLDWGTQTGLPGMAALAAYFIWVFWRVARRRQYELTAMLIALYCFAMFLDVLRQPLFWIIPLLAWSLAEFDMRGRTSADGLGQPIMRG
jgi:O-antigen ligase